MIISDLGKLIAITTIIITILVGLMFGRFQNVEAAWGVITLMVGYLIGNGAAAVRRRAPSPVIVPQLEEGEIATITGKHSEGTS
jgi:hypothetical protein